MPRLSRNNDCDNKRRFLCFPQALQTIWTQNTKHENGTLYKIAILARFYKTR